MAPTPSPTPGPSWTSDVGQYYLSGLSIPGQALVQNIAPAGAAAIIEIIAGPTDSPIITQISCGALNSGQNFCGFGLGVPAVRGIGQQPPIFPPGIYDPNNAQSSVTVASAWQIPPTAPTKFLRRVSFNSIALAQDSLWSYLTFPRGLKLNPSTSLVLFGIPAGTGAAKWYAYEWSVEWDN